MNSHEESLADTHRVVDFILAAFGFGLRASDQEPAGWDPDESRWRSQRWVQSLEWLGFCGRQAPKRTVWETGPQAIPSWVWLKR